MEGSELGQVHEDVTQSGVNQVVLCAREPEVCRPWRSDGPKRGSIAPLALDEVQPLEGWGDQVGSELIHGGQWACGEGLVQRFHPQVCLRAGTEEHPVLHEKSAPVLGLITGVLLVRRDTLFIVGSLP